MDSQNLVPVASSPAGPVECVHMPIDGGDATTVYHPAPERWWTEWIECDMSTTLEDAR